LGVLLKLLLRNQTTTRQETIVFRPKGFSRKGTVTD